MNKSSKIFPRLQVCPPSYLASFISAEFGFSAMIVLTSWRAIFGFEFDYRLSVRALFLRDRTIRPRFQS